MSVRKYLHVNMKDEGLRRHVVHYGGKIDLAIPDKELVELLLGFEDLLSLGLVHLYRLGVLLGFF